MISLKYTFDEISNSSLVAKIKQPSKSYPIFDTIVVIYAAITILFQVLFQISPVMSFLVNTPLYEMQTYLGLLGGGLILADIFTTKKIWNNKYSLFLYIILFAAALSSIRLISYGVKENLFKFCWMAIQFVLIYSVPSRIKKEEFKKFIKILFYVILAIWVVSCCISLYQYINQIGYTYVVNPLGKDASANRQGFYDNRLFGIFYTLNTAALISLTLFWTNIIFIIKEKAVWLKIVLGISQFFLLSHMILSGSRNAVLAFCACAAILPWFLMRNKIKNTEKKKMLLPIATALVAIIVASMGLRVVKIGLSYLPYLNEKMLIALDIDRNPNHSQNGEFPNNKPLPEYDENILDRENLQGDYSNGRFNIWLDYVSLYKEIGVLGISPGNYMPYVMEHHPELFIVEDIRVNYPDKYASGIIYHGHNGFLIVFIATGFLGALSLLVFTTLCIIHVIKMIVRRKKASLLFIGCFLFVTIGIISALLDEGLFFHNAPQTTLFWLALGGLMNSSLYAEQKNTIVEK